MDIQLEHIEKNLVLKIEPKSKKADTLIFDEAAENYNEAKHQLLEGHFYDYTILLNEEASGHDFELEQKSYVQPRVSNKSMGVLAPNYYVGTLELNIQSASLLKTGKIHLEVRSEKTFYRSEYQYMLNDIASYCIDLLMQVESPVSQSFESDIFQIDERAVYQRFVFVKSLIDCDEFEEAIGKIISNPSTKWVNEIVERDIRNIRHLDSKNIRELSSRSNRVKCNNIIPGLSSIPMKINSSRKTESVDTSENRFVKHALNTFLSFCEDCERLFIKNANKNKKLESPISYSKEAKEAEKLVEKLNNLINHGFFKEISNPNTLKLNSPLLQRRGGYREVLNAWLRFDLAAKLVWKGGDDVYRGGKKNVAALYEYWLFFVLLDLIKNKFNIETIKHKEKEIDSLIIGDKNGLGLSLKSGEDTSLQGIHKGESRSFQVKFSFNKTFGNSQNYEKGNKVMGSWTIPFRPDYTLSIWPEGMEEENAEKNEAIVHIHFDSKYKLNSYDIDKWEEADEKETDEEKIESEIDFEEIIDLQERKIEIENLKKNSPQKNKVRERRNIYKKVDLYKMHTYKDAIRRSGGAYILYPGTTPEKRFEGFHEILPGLGAFSIKPQKDRDPAKAHEDYKALNNFISDVIKHFEEKLTQREKLSKKVLTIFKERPFRAKDNILQKIIEDELEDDFLLEETNVLIGYYKGLKHLKWIENVEKKYNIRYGKSSNGKVTYHVDGKVFNASYLVLHNGKNFIDDKIYKLKKDSVMLYDLDRLKNELGYPRQLKPKHPCYLVYEIEKVANIGNLKFDMTKLPELNLKYDELVNQYKPFAITLAELLKIRA